MPNLRLGSFQTEVLVAAEMDVDARDRALQALAAGATIVAVSKASGYSRVHVYRLLQDPKFVEELERRKADVATVGAEDEKLALETLRELADGAEEERDRIAAAKALLAHVQQRRIKPVKAAEPPQIKIVPAGGAAEDAAKWLEKA